MMPSLKVPFFRPDVSEPEIDEVVATLRSGWLTTGPRVRRFEQEFASAVGAAHAVAVNSGTAALHRRSRRWASRRARRSWCLR